MIHRFNSKLLSVLALFFLSAILLGIIVSGVDFFKNDHSDKLEKFLPQVAVPLQEMQGAPKNYYFTCLLEKSLAKEIRMKNLSGEFFVVCSYLVEGKVNSLALMLGFIDEEKERTYIASQNYGMFNKIFPVRSFYNLIKQPDFAVGKVLHVVVTSQTRPQNDEGLYGLHLIGQDLETLYHGSSFDKFSETADPKDLPEIGTVDGYKIVLPIDVH